MIQINKKILVFAMLIGIALTGCKKGWLDINNNPNLPTDQNITPELIFTQAEVAVGARQASGNFRFLDNWVGYFAGNGDYARDEIETQYNIDFTFSDPIWQNHYGVLFDLRQAQLKGLASGDTALAGASMILSAKLWQELVDLYGDIPYSQAFQVDKYPHPAYDKAQDIYNNLQTVLDQGITYVQQNPQSLKFAPSDYVNNHRDGLNYGPGHENVILWIHFANTLKLRLLIRQSEVPGFSPASEITKILANGGVLMAGENVMVNPGYTDDVNKQNPSYAGLGYSPGTTTKANAASDANAYIINIFNNTSDPREARFFLPAGTAYVGNAYGASTGSLNSGGASSYFGPALNASASMDAWIYPAYESMFLYAEAVARGWIPGDPGAAYQAALVENFTFLGVPDPANAASDYMLNNSIADFSTVAGGTVMDQVKFILYQKYLSNVGIDPLESYSDIRRINFLPDNGYISQNPSKLGGGSLPVRLLYPQSEYTANGANVSAEGQINQFTSKIFWEP